MPRAAESAFFFAAQPALGAVPEGTPSAVHHPAAARRPLGTRRLRRAAARTAGNSARRGTRVPAVGLPVLRLHGRPGTRRKAVDKCGKPSAKCRKPAANSRKPVSNSQKPPSNSSKRSELVRTGQAI